VVLLLSGSASLKTKVMPFIKFRCVAAYDHTLQLVVDSDDAVQLGFQPSSGFPARLLARHQHASIAARHGVFSVHSLTAALGSSFLMALNGFQGST